MKTYPERALLAFVILLLLGIHLRADEPIAQWQLTREHIHGASLVPTRGTLKGTIVGPVRFGEEKPHALRFTGDSKKQHGIEITRDLATAALPKRTLSVEAWVRIDKPIDWGGVLSCMQDNGSYEKGWILGYGKSQFYFGVATAKTRKLTYLKSKATFAPGYWYHIVGVYDGKEQLVYVDGKLQGLALDQQGDIAYPPKAVLALGAYRDDNEFYAHNGQIEQVSLFARALSPKEVEQRFEARKSRFPLIDPTHPDVVDWPSYKRDFFNTGISKEKLTTPMYLRWVYKSRHAPKPSWPPPAKNDYWHKKYGLSARVTFDEAYQVTTVGNRLYFGSSADDRVTCLDTDTGETRWAFATEGPIRTAPVVVADRLLVSSDDGHLYCLRNADGSLIWKQRIGPSERRIPGNGRIISVWPVRTDALVEDGKAWVCAGVFPGQGVYQAQVNLATGKVLSTAKLNVTAQGHLSKKEDKLHIPTGRDPAGAMIGKLKRIGKEMGKEAASFVKEYPFAYIGAEGVRIGGGDGKLAVFAMPKGEKLWEAEVEGKVHSLAFARGQLYASTSKGYIYCFSPQKHAPIVRTLPEPERFAHADAKIQAEYERHAKWIDEQTKLTQGYCLMLGAEQIRLALELAKRTSLRFVLREPDAAKVEETRRLIERVGLSHRIVVHRGSTENLPYTDYLFNLIVAKDVKNRAEVQRVLRPYGGVALFDFDAKGLVTRGSLAGAGEWTHMYADPANTVCSNDILEGDALELQWFGRPGPRPMIDRHHRPIAPVSRDGRLFVPGEDRVIGVDAYNGTILWDRAIPDSKRVASFRDSSFLVAGVHGVYVASANKCLALDPQTGKVRRTFEVPDLHRGEKREWGYLAESDHVLVGSATKPGSSRRTQSYTAVKTVTFWDFVPVVGSDGLFAIDPENGERLWNYTPKGGLIANSTVTIGDGVVYFVEGKNPKTLESELCRAKLQDLFEEGGSLVAIDLKSGSERWRKPVKSLAALQHNVYLMYARDTLVITGSRNNGTNKKTSHVAFDMHTFDAKTGKPKWSKSQIQMHMKINGDHGEQDAHPVVVDDRLYVEPRAYNLETGAPLVWPWPWALKKRRGCGTLSASKTKFFFRNQTASMFDMETQRASTVTASTRPGCWINLIPAGGLLLAPEASSGCSCNFAVQTSLALIPVSRKK